MSRYKCHICQTEHGTDNMVAVCICCYQRVKDELQRVSDLSERTATGDKPFVELDVEAFVKAREEVVSVVGKNIREMGCIEKDGSEAWCKNTCEWHEVCAAHARLRSLEGKP